ncbi:MAG: response regulator transcription factor [Peptococcaceae bacterium]|nr:response regulator transcription factor [Peptococcaceae bacterium]
MTRIFFLEDDPGLVRGLSFALSQQGYEVDVASTAREAEALWQAGRYDLAILDVTLPDGSGFDVCKKLRAESHLPILFLTALDDETDMIMGLDIGADDYITKPFKLAVLLSRVHALLRRSQEYSSDDAVLENAEIRVDLKAGSVAKNGQLLHLTANEFKLLRLFMENPGCILSPEQVLAKLWDCDEKFIDASSLSVYIRRLREKIEDDPSRPTHIVTVRGMGYKWQSSTT